jgi:hypothetical protein
VREIVGANWCYAIGVDVRGGRAARLVDSVCGPMRVLGTGSETR